MENFEMCHGVYGLVVVFWL